MVLAGARAFSLDLYGDGLVNVLLTASGLHEVTDATGKALSNYVDQSGRVTAEGGRVWISAAAARGLVDGMVNMPGEVRATRVSQQGGEITLLAGTRLDVGGSVVATSADGSGGRIVASAPKTVLGAGALFDAGGASGGGAVQVGGTLHGAQPVPGADATADTLTVASGAQLRADATGAVGDGGQVVLWSASRTQFSGAVSARAGATGGNGGLLEVSGKKQLAFNGQADASAPNGQAGTLLLDPGSLTVAQEGTGGFTASGSDSTVAATNVNSTLRGGTSVTLAADDDIRVNAQIDARPFAGSTEGKAGAGLSLTAGRAVEVNAPIVLNNGALTVRSGSFRQADGNVIATLGNQAIDVQARDDIQMQYLLTSGAVRLQSSRGNVTASRSIGGESGGASQPVGSLSIRADAGTVNLALGARASGSVVVQAASLGTLGGIQAGDDIRLSATRGDVALGSLESTGHGTLRVDSIGSITLPVASRLLTHGGTVVLTATRGRIDTVGVVAANDMAGSAAPDGTIRLDARDDIGVRQLVALGSTDLKSGSGSILLNESLGGADRDHPALGSLSLAAGKDITINGLNLAGFKGAGLQVEAGQLGQGGHILVNDRIGVSSGNLRFGSATGSTDSAAYAVTLRQSVYARTGTQDITFNVPVVVDGAGLLAGWRAALKDNAAPGSLTDMVLIPKSVGNEEAEALVAAGGGLYARLRPEGKVDAVCATAVACGADYALMVPKLVISNQENVYATDTGTIRLAGGVSASKVADLDGTLRDSAALKLIVPLSGVAPDGKTLAEKDPTTSGLIAGIFRAVALELGRPDQPVQLNYAHLQILQVLPIRPLAITYPALVRGERDPVYFVGALPMVNEYVTTPKASTDPVSLSLLLYPGKLDKGVTPDTSQVLASGNGDAGYHSNSTPSGTFVRVVNIGTGVNLAAQILGGLPSAPTAPVVTGGDAHGGTINPIGPVTSLALAPNEEIAASDKLESRAGQRATERLCATSDRRVAGRSAGDEADVGRAAALQGAARPVFATAYVLGDVSAQLPTADAAAIAGASGASSCL